MGRILAIAITVLWSSIAALAADWPPKVAELEVTLHQAAASCIEGNECAVYLRIANEGTAPFEAPVEIRATSATPALPGTTPPQDWACRRDGYSGFACRSQTISLAPGRFTVARLTLRMLPTPLSENEICVALSFGSSIRAAAMANAAPMGLDAEQLFGGWGKGDIIASNDKACLKILIANPPESSSCEAGLASVNGACVDLAALCTAGRTFDAATKTCACAQGQRYDATTQSCGAQLACDGGRTAAGHFCACPQDRPRWNGDAKSCEALVAMAAPEPAAEPQVKAPEPAPAVEAPPAPSESPPQVVEQPAEPPAAPVVETQEPPKPVLRKKIVRRSALERPRQKRVYRIRREVRACPRGQIRTGGVCQTPKARIVRIERKKVQRVVARFLPCPPGYKLGPLGRRCWSTATLEANRNGANVRNKWICAAGLRRQGLICVDD